MGDSAFKRFIRGALHGPEEGDVIEYFNLKARVAGNVLTNAQEMPTPGYTYDADITKFWEEYQSFKKEVDYNLTFNDLMVRAIVEGIRVAPRLNSYIEYNRLISSGRLIIKKHVDIALPVVLDNGQTFPVKLREAEEKSLKEISLRSAQLVDLLRNSDDVDDVLFDMISQRTVGFLLKGKFLSTFAQSITGVVGKYKVGTIKGIFDRKPRKPGGLKPVDLNEGTICYSNLGTLSHETNLRVTNAPLLFPQVFLIATGAAQDQNYIFRNEKGEIDMGTKKILPITITFDHRIGGFYDTLPFINKLNEIFANPEVIREW